MPRPQLEAKDWTTPHMVAWRSWLGGFCGRLNIRALEVGCCAGRSSEWFCREILTGAGSQLDCLDCWDTYQAAEAEFDQRAQGLAVRKFKGRSEHVLTQLKVDGQRYHWVYVDGGHHAETVLFDLVLCWAMLEPGGVLIADDYDWTHRACRLPPRVAIDAFLQCAADSTAGYERSRPGQVAVWKR